MTLHASVELPPHGGTVLCGAQAAGNLPDGHNYQRIEYVVNEVIEPSDTLPRTPNYSISSTLNPQAPESMRVARGSASWLSSHGRGL